MNTILTIQPAQYRDGRKYDPLKKLPYPFHIDATTGKCVRGQGVTKDFAWKLLGFATPKDLETIVIPLSEFVTNPRLGVGRHAVFATGSGISTLTAPTTDVTVTEHKNEVAA